MMELAWISIDAVVGGVIAGGTYLLIKLCRRFTGAFASAPAWKRYWFLPFLVTIGLGRVVHPEEAILYRLSPTGAYKLMLQRASREIVGDPAFDAYAREQPDVLTAAEQLVERGRRRLDADQIRRLASLHLTLAQRSPMVCTGMWTGNEEDPDAVEAALATLPFSDLKDYLRLWKSGALRELHGEGTPFSAPADSATALDAAAKALGVRGEELLRIWDEGASASASDGCRGVQMALESIGKLPDTEAVAVYAMISP